MSASRTASRGLQAVTDDIADAQHGGVLRPLGQQVEVAADLFGGGRQERRGDFQPGTLGRSGGVSASRIAQILQLMLGRLQALAQCGEVPFAYRGFVAKARDQILLAVLQVQGVDVAPLGGHLRA